MFYNYVFGTALPKEAQNVSANLIFCTRIKNFVQARLLRVRRLLS